MKNENCNCESCRQRELLEKKYPEKEIGLQYAAMKLTEEVSLLVSAEEIEYLEKSSSGPKLESISDIENKKKLSIAYGVFTSQTNFYENLYDLGLSIGEEYFYYEHEKEIIFTVKIIDYKVFEKNKNKDKAKVAILLESDQLIPYPKDKTELATTLTRLMDIGTELRDLIFARIEYGVFRIDKVEPLFKEKDSWKKNINTQNFFSIDYNRFLIIE